MRDGSLPIAFFGGEIAENRYGSVAFCEVWV